MDKAVTQKPHFVQFLKGTANPNYNIFEGNLRWSKVRVENNNEDGFYPTEQPYMRFVPCISRTPAFCTYLQLNSISRYGHAVVSYHNYIYLWGGRNDVQGSCNKMWRFSGHDHSWKLIQTAGDEPSGRDGHSMTRWKDKIVIFAGKISRLPTHPLKSF